MIKDLPSKEHLRQLRRSGVFAWSDFALRLSLVAVVAGVLLGCGKALAAALVAYGDHVSVGREFFASDVVKAARAALAKVVILTSVWVAVVGVLAALLQTRGAFGVSVLRRSYKARRRSGLFGVLCAFVVVGVVSALVFKGLAPELLGALRISDLAQFGAFYGRALSRICKLVVVVALVLAILLVFVSRVRFLVAMRGAKRSRFSQSH